jgi:hypothetical protein
MTAAGRGTRDAAAAATAGGRQESLVSAPAFQLVPLSAGRERERTKSTSPPACGSMPLPSRKTPSRRRRKLVSGVLSSGRSASAALAAVGSQRKRTSRASAPRRSTWRSERAATKAFGEAVDLSGSAIVAFAGRLEPRAELASRASARLFACSSTDDRSGRAMVDEEVEKELEEMEKEEGELAQPRRRRERSASLGTTPRRRRRDERTRTLG